MTEELHIISFVVEYVYQGLKMKLQVSAGKRGAKEAADLEEGARRAGTTESWSGDIVTIAPTTQTSAVVNIPFSTMTPVFLPDGHSPCGDYL